MFTRRTAILSSAALLAGPAAAAERLRATPSQTEGPFYPDIMPAETDPDLVRLGAREAKGEILALSGKVLGLDGRPVAGAMVEIWQCDANGRYIATSDARRGGSDPGFQGFGRVRVDAQGGYAFRTIRPVPYPGRTPHIHYKIYRQNREVLTTQMLVAGDPGNERDFVFRQLGPADRTLCLARLDRAGSGWKTEFDLIVA